MAEIAAVLQFETPSTFSARDEFDHAAGNLTGKTAPVGGVWAVLNASPGTDFVLDTAAHTVTRTATGGNGRWVRVGSGTHTVTAGQIDLMVSTISAVTYGGLISRYVDNSNFVHVALLPPGTVDFNVTVAGVTSTVSAGLGGIGTIAANTWYSLRVVIDAAGRAAVWFFPRAARPGEPVLLTQHAALATGGALASGGYGLFDQNPGSAATRTFDSFFAFVPTVDAACFASQSLEYRHDGAFRENAAGTQWAEKTVSGRNLFIPCSGAEGRTPRIMIMASRHDPDTMAHEFGDLRATLTITERYLGVPGA